MKTDQQATESSRRAFLTSAAVLAPAAVVGPSCASSAQRKDTNNASDRAPVAGDSKIKTRRLGKLEVSGLGSG
jgi:hypothetical protein